ncbi:hypothetical protein [Nocardioides sp. cx-173]|uniref:hypothetical protein n=1 Tax=Nocardioides sp. cx-173 TaxID=2898796 RepID=UPI001E4A8F09|nr:hypothetical protein [Nocardioides sp. cx-173]MCD4527186.1 hypothetical protein [Nocardioides sp. cx-173]UGB40457.1 hypothetical protein LQ940_13835 [Nocardioides sp. cx-173]
MTPLDWPLVLTLAVAVAVLVGVVGGYLSARLAVIGSERRLNRTAMSLPAAVATDVPADV